MTKDLTTTTTTIITTTIIITTTTTTITTIIIVLLYLRQICLRHDTKSLTLKELSIIFIKLLLLLNIGFYYLIGTLAGYIIAIFNYVVLLFLSGKHRPLDEDEEQFM